MKNYLYAILLIACITACSKNEDKSAQVETLSATGVTNVEATCWGKMNDSQRNEAKESAGNGLLVYDAGKNIYFFFNKQTKEWIALNPIQASDGNTSTLKLADGSSTITFENDVIANKTLTVNGNTTLNDPVVIDNTLTVNNDIDAGTINAHKITVSDTVNAKTINATDGFGITPLGGIIMWSGIKASIPEGWALCDGKAVNGFTTPDLRGRFVCSVIC